MYITTTVKIKSCQNYALMLLEVKRITGEKSQHIFLYDCVIRNKDLKIENQYSVSNMLSEAQNGLAIYSWLAHWIKSGAMTPNEVVTDMSLALLYAAVMAYTNFKSLKGYLNHCYASLFFNENFTKKCFIRTDVAHFIKLVTA